MLKPPMHPLRCLSAAAACLCSLASTNALAASFEFRDDWTLDIDTLVSYAAQWRVSSLDEDKAGYKPGDDIVSFNEKINAEDGNRNFDKGLVQHKISALVDLDLAWRNLGLFARGRAWYDDVYSGRTDHDQRAFLTYNSADIYGGDAGFREFPGGTVDVHKSRLEFLDFFLYGSGELPGDRLFDLRLGRQVINWGEATFYQGINGLQNHIDTISANTPGVEVKEILLPTGALYGQVDITPDLTFEAYYQYEWLETELNGVGSYYSTQDFLGPGSRNFLVAFGFNPETGDPLGVVPVAKTPDLEASDSGQWGTAIHWVTEGGTDFGFYYVNAHSRAPSFRLNYAGIVPESYTVEYFEDIQGIAASFTTVWGITNVQGELSYKIDAPVVDADGNPDTGKLISAQLGGSHVLSPTRFWDDANLTFEFALARVDDYSDRDLRYDNQGIADALRFEMSYLNVVPGLDLFVPIFFQHGVDGTVREANMIEDAKTFNIVLKAVYLNNLNAQLGYSNFFDGGQDNLLTDRDNVSLSFSYSF